MIYITIVYHAGNGKPGGANDKLGGGNDELSGARNAGTKNKSELVLPRSRGN